jgi:hydroxypyruvate isomerase
MPRFSANLSMLFTEVPFLERFKAAAAMGFTGVEFAFPYTASATRFEPFGTVTISPPAKLAT